MHTIASPRLLLPLVVAGTLAAGCALAQGSGTYPSRPIRLVVAFAPGGIADTIARVVGQNAATRLGQSIVVDNRGGAGGTLAARLVASATPDGHTLLVHTTAIAVNATLVKGAVDPAKELSPIAIAASTPTIFVVHRSAPAGHLLDYVRGTKGGRFTYATAGVGTTEHLTAAYLFRALPGLDATHVPFQGGSLPVAAVVGQQVDIASTTPPTASTQIRAGTLRVLAVAANKRIPAMPDVPTVAEAGFPAFENRSWIGFFAPARTEAAILDRLNAEINTALGQPEVVQRLTTLGLDPQTSPRAEVGSYVRAEVAKFAQVIKATGLTPE